MKRTQILALLALPLVGACSMLPELSSAEAARVRQMADVAFVEAYREYEQHSDVGPTLIGAPALWAMRGTSIGPGLWPLFLWRGALHVAAVILWFWAMARVPVLNRIGEHLLPRAVVAASLASGTPMAFATKGTVREARGLTSST